jgi:phage terminase large subunit
MSEHAVRVQRGEDLVTLYEPLPHQERLHASEAIYTLQSGGRGSGKSICMRWDAYMHALMIPRFRALILRRSVPELKSSHLQFVPFEAEQLGLPRDAWHTTDMVLRFPNGSTVRFGHVENDEALTKYLSSEIEMLYLDELTTFTFRQFAFLMTSLRSPIKGWRPKMKAGTNPVGPGAGWVKRFFIDKTITQDEMPGYDPSEVSVIYANMDQNPHVDREGYAKILNSVPSEALRKALRHGEWTIEGAAFPEFQPTKDGKPWHVIDELPTYKGRSIFTMPGLELVRGIDWGYAAGQNPGVCLWFLAMPDGSLIGIKEFVFSELLPSEAAREIIRRTQGHKVRYTVADPSMWQAHEGPSIAEHMENAGLGLIEGDNAREAGWIAVHTWLKQTINDGTGERPKLRFLRGDYGQGLGCPKTIMNIPQMLVDPKNPNDIVTVGVPDDEVDVVRYVCMSRVGPSREKPPMDPGFRVFLQSIRRAKRQSAALRGEY